MLLFGGVTLEGLIPGPLVLEPAVEVDSSSLTDLLIVVVIMYMSSVLSSVLIIRDAVKPPIWIEWTLYYIWRRVAIKRLAAIWRG